MATPWDNHSQKEDALKGHPCSLFYDGKETHGIAMGCV
jgi:hypothetical protein